MNLFFFVQVYMEVLIFLNEVVKTYPFHASKKIMLSTKTFVDSLFLLEISVPLKQYYVETPIHKYLETRDMLEMWVYGLYCHLNEDCPNIEYFRHKFQGKNKEMSHISRIMGILLIALSIYIIYCCRCNKNIDTLSIGD